MFGRKVKRAVVCRWTLEVDGVQTPVTPDEGQRPYHATDCDRSKALRDPSGRAVLATVRMPEPGTEPSRAELAALGLPVDPNDPA